MNQLQITDFYNYRFLSQIELSPDGKKAAFVVKQADVDKNDYVSNIWLYRLDSGKVFQLTAAVQDTRFVWLDDSEHLLFVSGRKEPDDDDDDDDEDQTHLYRIPIQGGEAQLLVTLPHKATTLRLLDDQHLIYSAQVDLDEEPKPAEGETVEAAKARKEKEKEEQDYEVLEEIPFWSNGGGFTSRKRSHLFLFDMQTETTIELTPGPMAVAGYDVCAGRVAFVGGEYEDKAPITQDVYLLDVFERDLVCLTDGDRVFGWVHFVNDDVLIVSSSDMRRAGINQNQELYALYVSDKRLVCLSPDLDKSLGNSVGTDCRLGGGAAARMDGDRFYFVTTEGDSAYLNSLALDGPVERVVGQPGSIDCFDVNDGVIVYVAFRGDKLQELYRWENGQEAQVTRLNEDALAGKNLSTPEHFVVEAEDGAELDAWIIKPAGFEAGRAYPAILEIHGGPKTVSAHTFFHEYQVLANQGYVVFFSNPRGSDGRGDAFADIRGKYGTVDYTDLMALVDHVLANYDFVDPERLGVTGGSYGGYMTNWIIGHTERFIAAVSQRGIANWISFSLNSDIGYWFGADQTAAMPWDDADKLWFHSPLKYADRVKTPTLFIHSAEDYRCWIPEALQMFTALKYHGVESRLCWFKGESHELSRGGKPKHRARRLKEIVEWFERYL